jgi:DNA-binding response OmpR family regulator
LIYDYRNQLIKSPDEEKTLTFRENKLLFLLTSHPNEVLERDKILDEVWGDEGVIVGRSLDVFISRLRKILKLDPALQIKSVHGVGYKLVI